MQATVCEKSALSCSPPFLYSETKGSSNVTLIRQIQSILVNLYLIFKLTISSIWCENMHGYLSVDIICSEKQTIFRERSSRKTVSFEEQITSKDKYPSIFARQMKAIVFIILQIFFATAQFWKLGNILRYSPVLTGGIFSHVTHLHQLHASKDI